ncbi:disulfide bond formation protein [Skermanella stibiiresistens SB22]|uniref:Disulfide bond formation protein n=1 Tax=Skermanella stibiiresistens SB22 TaxID=1385369 RepID=W9H779_9PROT|nr:disulfide bond formation protein B [Skermanella stibiiresistens]EWY39618.1 disulfide bond formation protein [Skermanella stibiiresistens SB22]
MNAVDTLSAPRLPALLLLLASAGSLLAAFFFQYVIGLQPCVLCIWQRWPYAAVIVMAGLILLIKPGPRARAALLALCGVAFLIGGGIAVFHVGVEQHWWTGTPGCGVPASATSVDALRAQIMAAPVVRCDQVAWSLFGVSMAGYNILISLALAVMALAAAARAAIGGAGERLRSA